MNVLTNSSHDSFNSLPEGFDWQNPNYSTVYAHRAKVIERLRNNRDEIAMLKAHYADHPWDFVMDWAMTVEPRRSNLKKTTKIPLLPFDRQIQFIKWLHHMFRISERGTVDKSRDCGATWNVVWYSLSHYLFLNGFVFGFGSRKEMYVDQTKSLKAYFQRLLFALNETPRMFWPEGVIWKKGQDAPRDCYARMRLENPETGSCIIGEAGTNIGRGDRTSQTVIDEYAFCENQEALDAALSENTNSQIDISTHSGPGTEFHRKVEELKGTYKLFVFDWRDDKRKDEEWYKKRKKELKPHIVAREIDRNPYAAQTDSFINSEWLDSVVDAHEELGFEAKGLRVASFDVADTGDAKAVVLRCGDVVEDAVILDHGDVTDAVPWAFELAIDYGADVLIYDAAGMGSAAVKMYEKNIPGSLFVQGFQPNGMVEYPNQKSGLEHLSHNELKNIDHRNLPTNRETFYNLRAQKWYQTSERLRNTYEAIKAKREGKLIVAKYASLISISSKCKYLNQLKTELCMPKREYGSVKIKVEHKVAMKRRGLSSPNLADAFIIGEGAKDPRMYHRRSASFKEFQVRDPGAGY